MRFTIRFVIALLGAATFAAHAQEPTRAEADSMQTKIDRVAATADAPPRAANASPVRTTFTERRSRERSLFDPLAYITGSVEVVAVGTVEGSGGEGLIRYESARVGGVEVPKTVAQELLRFYTTTPDRPRGFAFDEPFALPAGLRAVSVERGAATVTQ